jgi:hypothetical protein
MQLSFHLQVVFTGIIWRDWRGVHRGQRGAGGAVAGWKPFSAGCLTFSLESLTLGFCDLPINSKYGLVEINKTLMNYCQLYSRSLYLCLFSWGLTVSMGIDFSVWIWINSLRPKNCNLGEFIQLMAPSFSHSALPKTLQGFVWTQATVLDGRCLQITFV